MDTSRTDRPSDSERYLIDAAQAVAFGSDPDVKPDTIQSPSDSYFLQSHPDSLPGYSILKEIHRGAQGVVYQAIQKTTKRKVAVKVMRDDPFMGSRGKVRFEREIQILGQLSHPNIVGIHDSGSVGESFFYVMDYIAGQPLDVFMSRTERSIEETLRLFLKICHAVNAAHLRGVIHRDLKPGNIRVDAAGEPHILDFGLAKVATGQVIDESFPQMMTMTGQFIGSLPWASPEQAHGSPDRIDVRTDVYSLGVILYQMLTNRFPYEVTGNMRNVLDNILNTVPAKPSTIRRQINDEVETIVLKSLSKEPDRRYQSAGELARDVAHYLDGEPIEAKRDSGWYIMKKTFRRHRSVVAVGTTILALILGFGVVASFLWRRALSAELRTRQTHEFFHQALAAVQPDKDNRAGAVKSAMKDAERQIANAAAGDPLAEADMRSSVGTVYRSLAYFDQAERELQSALALRRRKLGNRHPETLQSVHELALLLHARDELAPAIPLFEEALAARRTLLGDRHVDVAATLNDLGLCLKDLGQFAEAREKLEEAVELRRGLLGDGHEDLATSLHNLASVYYYFDRIPESEGLYNEALNIRIDIFGWEHTLTADTLNHLGGVAAKKGDFAASEQYYQQALTTFRKLLGNDHQKVAAGLNNLGMLYFKKGEYVAARQFLHEAVNMVRGRTDLENEQHQWYSRGLTNLAVCVEKTGGDVNEAFELLEKSLKLKRENLGNDHASVAVTLHHQGDFLFRQGRFEEAVPMLEEAIVIRRKRLPTNHPDLAKSLHLLADVYVALDHPERAAELLKEVE